jgi:hypothetical protein
MSGAPKLAGPFKDLVKANTLITRDFPATDSFNVTSETKAQDATFKTTITGDRKKPVAATLEPKFDWKQQNLAFEGKLGTNNVFSAKATYKNLFTPGFNAYLQGDRSVAWRTEKPKEGEKPKDPTLDLKNSVTTGVSFTNEQVNFSGEAKFPVLPQDKASYSTNFHVKPVEQAALGGNFTYAKSKLKGEVKLLGGTDQLEGAVHVTYPEKNWGVWFWHSVNPNFQWAANYSFAVPTEEDEKLKPTANLVGNYKVDDFTTVKAKLFAGLAVDDKKQVNDYRLGLSLGQKINANTTVTVGADVNLRSACEQADGAKNEPSSCGIQVAFK